MPRRKELLVDEEDFEGGEGAEATAEAETPVPTADLEGPGAEAADDAEADAVEVIDSRHTEDGTEYAFVGQDGERVWYLEEELDEDRLVDAVRRYRKRPRGRRARAD